jgi:type I restriction enzyme R subunit
VPATRVNPAGGHRTAYLWEQVWARESWLEILGRYLIAQRDKKKQITKVLFPRYHQLDATRKLQAAVLRDGPGAKYLIQHSAGSGKTNSIAWTAHFFAELHDAADEGVRHRARRVRSQRHRLPAPGGALRLRAHHRRRRDHQGRGHAARAPSWPRPCPAPRRSSSARSRPSRSPSRPCASWLPQGKRFAVIADEAHSSQTGEAASKLKAVLSAEELQEYNDGGEVSSEDILAAQMSTAPRTTGITFVAFTATPKNKTIELFGTRPDPSRKPAADNIPRPFHVYSMRQAIEEKFILDVLKNYTPYSLAFKLAHEGRRSTTGRSSAARP